MGSLCYQYNSKLTTGWTVRGSNPGEARFSSLHTGPGAHPDSCTMGTGTSLGVKYGRGVLLKTHPLLLPWSWKERAIILLNLWATTGPVRGTLYLFSTMQHFNYITDMLYSCCPVIWYNNKIIRLYFNCKKRPLPHFFPFKSSLHYAMAAPINGRKMVQ